MKKRFLTLTIALLFLFVTLFSLSGCTLGKDCAYKFEYDDVYVHPTIAEQFATSEDLFEITYDETYLKLYEDGTWVIDYPIFLFFNSKIDKGTYTVNDGVYSFEGFEYGIDAYGEMTSGGFEIYFMAPNGVGYTKAFAIYFEN